VATRLAIGHLSADMRRFFRAVEQDYQLEGHHQRLLLAACEAHDRMTQARARLATEGLTWQTRFGELRAHPCVAVERDSALRFARLVRELGLSDGQDEGRRPPALSGRYTGRR
jgi:P27 family predicted phage terminase small subunit